MTAPFIRYENAIDQLTWPAAIEALRAGHRLPRAQITDVFLGPPDATLLNRSAFIEGFGYGVKAVTVIRDNAHRGLATTQGAMSIFDPSTGELTAVIDSRLITEIKTVSDSLLGAQLLARGDSKRMLIAGGGTIARSLLRAYPEVFPELEQIAIWTRRPEQAASIVAQHQHEHEIELIVADSLGAFARRADIISCATMAKAPILRGEWVTAGTHVDLIGAFKHDMREADDALMTKGALYVDSRETTIEHIGELIDPISSGVIIADDVQGDFYDLIAGDHSPRQSAAQITVFKNGGGAHLDLMIAHYIVHALRDQA